MQNVLYKKLRKLPDIMYNIVLFLCETAPIITAKTKILGIGKKKAHIWKLGNPMASYIHVSHIQY